MLEMLCRVYESFSIHIRFFPQGAKDDLYRLGESMGVLYMRLYTEAYRHGRKMWKLTPKVHVVQHLLQYQLQVWGTPRIFGVTPTKTWSE